jgi:hypothetical protein
MKKIKDIISGVAAEIIFAVILTLVGFLISLLGNR